MEGLKRIYRTYQEVISYLIFGALTTVVSLGTYGLFVGAMGLPTIPGNALSWLCAVAFAFITNKLWVFRSEKRKLMDWLREAWKFFLGRIGTGLVELIGLPVLMAIGVDQTILGVEGAVAKVIVTVVVVVLNYFVSKFIVFKK